MVRDCRYFRARAEFAWLTLHREDGDLRGGQIFEDCFRHELERTSRMMLENEQAVLRTDTLDFSLQRRGDLTRHSISDDRDSLLQSQSKTNIDRVPCARYQFRINWLEINAIGIYCK